MNNDYTRLLWAKTKETTDSIKPSKKSEIAKFLNNQGITIGSDFNIVGSPIISSPNTLLSQYAVDKNSGMTVTMGSLTTKGYDLTNGSAGMNLFCRYTDIAYTQNWINYFQTTYGTGYGKGKFKIVNGFAPSGIWEIEFNDPTNGETIYGYSFAKDDILYMIFETSDTAAVRYALNPSTWQGGSILTPSFSGGYELTGSDKCITIKDNQSGLWLALTCTGMDTWEVTTVNLSAKGGFNTSNTTITNSYCGIGVGDNSLNTRDKIVFALSAGTSKDVVKNAVISGLSNYQTAYEEALEDWSNFFDGLDECWKNVSPEIIAKGLMSVQQIRSLGYNGYCAAGIPNWYEDFPRDTAWMVYGLASTKHEQCINLAKSYMEWFIGVNTWSTSNSFSIDKSKVSSAAFTDSGATFLLAAAKLWNTGKWTISFNMKTILDTFLSYAQTNYVSADGHMTPIHPHDLWDDYATGEIDTSLVKYESFIDVLWIAALEAIAPVYKSLNDNVRFAFCSNTSLAMKNKLEDFRRSDGGLTYAIKKVGGFYDTVTALTGNHYAAWLLKDAQCIQWVLHKAYDCKNKNAYTSSPAAFSNLANASMKTNAWMPFLPINAIIAAREGDMTWTNDLLSQFSTGAAPEYVKSVNASSLNYASHALNLGWSHGMIVTMVSELNDL